ncbi:protein kinase domain-containing protein [Ditylenchus destructor]|uniref:Protein kinase domain-containing protein n=1 Tax=Ditylenchus destructor TaxID=166010 RepID=A0AAD4MRU6_9BILA|nr:protein kinase domain-containing protein [Ditylenchus destructor]
MRYIRMILLLDSIFVFGILDACHSCTDDSASLIKLSPDRVNAFNEYKQVAENNAEHYPGTMFVVNQIELGSGDVRFEGLYADRRIKLDTTDSPISHVKETIDSEKSNRELLLSELSLLRCIPYHPFIDMPVDVYMSTEIIRKSENGGTLNAAVYHLIFDYKSPTGTLADLIQKVGSFGERLSVVRFYMEICILAILHLHTLNMIHGDVRPSTFNFLRNGFLKLKDFSEARTLDTAKFHSCSDDVAVYRAPEMYSSSKEHPYTDKVDIWGLGATILTILSGEFYSNTLRNVNDQLGEAKCWKDVSSDQKQEIFYEKIDKALPIQKAEKNDEKKELHDLLRNMLVADPSKRYSIHDVISHPFFARAERWDYIYRMQITPPVLPDLDELNELTYQKRFLAESSTKPVVSPKPHLKHEVEQHADETNEEDYQRDYTSGYYFSLDKLLDTVKSSQKRRKIYHILNDGQFNTKKVLPYGVPQWLTWTVLTTERAKLDGQVNDGYMKQVMQALNSGAEQIIKKLNKDKKRQLRWGVAYSQYERGSRNTKVATSMKGVVFRFIVKPVDPRRRIEAQLELN